MQQKEERAKQEHKEENQRKAVFGKKSYHAFRGQNIIPEIKGFFYLARKILVTPSLVLKDSDGLDEQLKINEIAEYLNTNHQFSYIVYNFSDQKPLSGNLSVKNFHQVMDYPFPTATET